jgi:acetylornithine deacetylase/succinyl-diaminopimelate desuccinylase-like protein
MGLGSIRLSLLLMITVQSLATARLTLASADPLQAALAYAEANQNKFNSELLEFVGIPSISALPEHRGDIERAAEWLQGRLGSAGFKGAKIIPTEGPHPVVYAEWLEAAPGQPTVLIYGHYDVQPVDPLRLWHVEPFKPVIKDGYFLGRGADDDKGGVLSAVQGLASWLQTAGSLPVNVKLLFEGQEEVGSPNLDAFLKQHAKLLKADYALSADGGQLSETESGITIGLRGALGVEITHQTVDVDLHSGMKGGSVANPIHTLTELVAGFHDASGRIAVEGFYDGVVEPTPEDEADMKAFPIDEEAELLEAVGAKGPFGEQGYSTTARTWLRPTLEAVGFWGGFTGEGIKTIVPSKASVKIAARLVPNQSPAAVLKAITKHVEQHSSPLAHVTVKQLGWFAQPFFMERDTLVNRAAGKVLEDVMGRAPYFVRSGGTIPAAALIQQHLSIDFTMFAFGVPGDNLHSPNERFPVSMFHKGIRAYIKVLAELGSLAKEASRDEL